MTLHVVRPQDAGAALGAAMPALAGLNPYRAHRLFTGEQQVAIQRAAIRQLVESGAVVRVLLAGDEVHGVCAIASLPWDSAHFGLAMGSLRCWLRAGVDADGCGLLVDATRTAAAALALRHVAAQVDADDYAQLHALSRRGFLLCDAKRTFIARRHQRARRNSRLVMTARPFEPRDRDVVRGLFAEATFESRFTRDALLDPARSRALYGQWMERLLDADPARRALYVAEREGELVACGGVVEIDFTAAGVDRRILGNGVFACNRRGIGAYPSVIDALVADGIRRYPLLETVVSVNNLAAVRVLESLGYSTATSQYALHLHC